MRPHIAQANHTLVLEWAWKGSHELKNMKSHLLTYLFSVGTMCRSQEYSQSLALSFQTEGKKVYILSHLTSTDLD